MMTPHQEGKLRELLPRLTSPSVVREIVFFVNRLLERDRNATLRRLKRAKPMPTMEENELYDERPCARCGKPLAECQCVNPPSPMPPPGHEPRLFPPREPVYPD